MSDHHHTGLRDGDGPPILPPAPRPAATAEGRPPPDPAAECPQCGRAMAPWAGFHRCATCGYKESCCF